MMSSFILHRRIKSVYFKIPDFKSTRAPIEQQIDALESFKKAEYVEEWAYELAKLYERAGKITECLEECDDLILWFSEGKYVYQAMELKMRYKPLTPSQQEKYNRRYEKPGTTTEELPDLNNVDENGVKVAAKSVTTTQEQTEEDAKLRQRKKQNQINQQRVNRILRFR